MELHSQEPSTIHSAHHERHRRWRVAGTEEAAAEGVPEEPGRRQEGGPSGGARPASADP